MFAENIKIGGFVMKVSRIAEIELVAALKQEKDRQLFCVVAIKYVYVVIFC